MIWGWVKRNQNNVRFVAAVKNDPVVLVGGTVTNVGRFANGQFANVQQLVRKPHFLHVLFTVFKAEMIEAFVQGDYNVNRMKKTE